MSRAGRDPGLQPERTRLSWRRTTLSCTVVTLFAVRQALHGGAGRAAGAAVALSAAAWLGFLWAAQRRMTGLSGDGRPGPLPPRTVLTATGCTLALALFAAASLL